MCSQSPQVFCFCISREMWNVTVFSLLKLMKQSNNLHSIMRRRFCFIFYPKSTESKVHYLPFTYLCCEKTSKLSKTEKNWSKVNFESIWNIYEKQEGLFCFILLPNEYQEELSSMIRRQRWWNLLGKNNAKKTKKKTDFPCSE